MKPQQILEQAPSVLEQGGANMAELGLNVGVWITLIVLAFGVLTSIFKILREYERAVIYTLGRYTGTSGPGLIILIPFIVTVIIIEN